MTLDAVRAKYLPRVAGAEDATPFVICHDGAPIGYIQTYAVGPGAWGLSGVEAGTGLDLFIGEAPLLHRGLGPKALRQFIGEIVFRDPGVRACFIDPSTRNRVAIRAFEKAGFRYLGDAADPETGKPARIMRLTREEFASARAPAADPGR